ncbi:hypothetical protein ACWDWO_25935 [Actinopolymorpha singaporensis]
MSEATIEVTGLRKADERVAAGALLTGGTPGAHPRRLTAPHHPPSTR